MGPRTRIADRKQSFDTHTIRSKECSFKKATSSGLNLPFSPRMKGLSEELFCPVPQVPSAGPAAWLGGAGQWPVGEEVVGRDMLGLVSGAS